MSFQMFIYYCTACGGCAAYLGWVLGRLLSGDNALWTTAVQGMALGMFLALGLGLVDALWNVSGHCWVQVGLRGLAALAVGGVGGLVGALLGQSLYGLWALAVFLIFGWTITGLLIGAAPGAFEFLAARRHGQDARGARRKVVNGVLGGAVGGLVGGLLFLALKSIVGGMFHDTPADELWLPSAAGFVALGCCIGLSIGLAQVILREAWVRVEAGFRAGRQLILCKPEVTIGRAEACDVGLFGDAAVERLHARILLQGSGYLLADAGTGAGTFLNGARISQPSPLRAGDRIQVGNSVLTFQEKHHAQ